MTGFATPNSSRSSTICSIVGADNTKLEAHYRMLMNQLAYPRLVTTSLSQPGRPLQSDREHHHVLELIIAKDGDSAERVMREHVRASRQALLAGLPLPIPAPGQAGANAKRRAAS